MLFRSLAAVALLFFVALRFAAIPRAAFNWDEFALFDGVARTLQDGVLRGGGRPGLTQLIVMPLVEACSSEAQVAQLARGLWVLITLGYLGGVFALLLELFRDRPQRLHDACLGVALLGLVPAFLEWSLQVRTDQIALAGAAWGSAALLRSERNPGLALIAGLAFGIGWLSSQKLAYGAALGGTLALGKLLLAGRFTLPREGWRAALAIAGFGTVLLCFRALVMALFALPETHAARQLLGTQLASVHEHAFPFYRGTIGYSQYVAMLPTLMPHLGLGVGLAAAGVMAWRRGHALGWVALALCVLGLGTGVALYHAAAFAYFWMTLGLFPAVAGAIAVGEIRESLLARHPGLLRASAAALWLALLLPAGVETALLLRDTQAVQRESLAFVHRNFAPEHEGFHPEGGLFCRPPQASGVWFSQRIYREFESSERAQRTASMQQFFRNKPVHYLVESFRLNQFPVELRRFWAEHYQPYRESVFVAGRRLEGEASFELLVSGPYRWIPFDGRGRAEVDGKTLEPGGVAVLAAGEHQAALLPGIRGLLVLSLEEAPGPAPLSFYGSS
jgi:hypothetical protein